MKISELVQIIEEAKKPVSVWEHNPKENNGFFHYHPNLNSLTLDNQPIELEYIDFGESIKCTSYLTVPDEVKKLVVLSRDISKKAWEANQGYSNRMNHSIITINNKGIIYVEGGILFKDEETLLRIHDYFDLKYEGCLECDTTNHSGMFHLLRLKQLDSALQFASRASEWSTSPGYAHFCLGHIPFRRND